MKHRKPGKFIFLAFLIFPLVLVALSALVMLLWNSVLVPVAGIQTVTLLQAGGLLLLARLLFGRFSGRRGHGGRWKMQMMHAQDGKGYWQCGSHSRRWTGPENPPFTQTADQPLGGQ